jgi:hypothetical protein
MMFYFAPDTTTSRTDDFVLYRKVNAATSVAIAHNILRADTTPFLQYYRVRPLADGSPGFALLPTSSLPVRHTLPLHLSAGDTGVVAAVESVRAVRVTFLVTNGRIGRDARTVRRSRWIWTRNGGLGIQRSCGSAPIFNGVVVATATQVSGAPAVRITWSAATDEGGGEDDVIRYVIWRSIPGAQLGDPYLSIPAGSTSYSYLDGAVQTGEQWVYTVAAQDCSPSMSSTVSTGTIIIP